MKDVKNEIEKIGENQANTRGEKVAAEYRALTKSLTEAFSSFSNSADNISETAKYHQHLKQSLEKAFDAVHEYLDSGNIREKEFQPRIIGLANAERVEKAWDFYSLLTKKSNEALLAMGDFLESEPSLDFFIEALKTKSLANHLLTQFAAAKKVALPGISIEKIILAGLLDYPEETFQSAKEKINAVKALLNQLKAPETTCNLYYPLRKLFNGKKFVLTPEFEEKAGTHFFRFTTCQTQNDALELLEDFAESINRFHYAGFLDLNRNPSASLSKLIDSLDFERDKALASVDQHCFYRGFPGVPKQTTFQKDCREFSEIFEQ